MKKKKNQKLLLSKEIITNLKKENVIGGVKKTRNRYDMDCDTNKRFCQSICINEGGDLEN